MTEHIKLPPLPDADWYAVWHGQALYGIYATLTEATDAASKLNVKGSVSALFTEQHLQEAQRTAIEQAVLQSQDREDDPLQPAVNWLNEAIIDLTAADIQRRLFLGHNRAQRMLDHARRIEGDGE